MDRPLTELEEWSVGLALDRVEEDRRSAAEEQVRPSEAQESNIFTVLMDSLDDMPVLSKLTFVTMVFVMLVSVIGTLAVCVTLHVRDSNRLHATSQIERVEEHVDP